MLKDLLHATDLSTRDITDLVELASHLAAHDDRDPAPLAMAGETVVLYLTEPAPDTQRIYTAAATHLGAHVVTLGPDEFQRGHGATITDIARLVSLYAAIVVAVTDDIDLRHLAATATVPITDGHTPNDHHPCAQLAEILTRRTRCAALDRPRIVEVTEADAIDLPALNGPTHPTADHHVSHRPAGTTMLRTARHPTSTVTGHAPATTTSTCSCAPATHPDHLDHAAAAILLALHRRQLTGTHNPP